MEKINKIPTKKQSIYRNTVIGFKNGRPILFQNVALGGSMNLFETIWRETCQGDPFIDNIKGEPIDKLESNEATYYMYEYFKNNVHIEEEGEYILESFKRYMCDTVPKIYHGSFNKNLWRDYISSFATDMDEFA